MLAAIAWVANRQSSPVRQQALSQSVYVWQREWSGAVTNAVVEHRGAFADCILLGAEIAWEGNRAKVVEVGIEYGAVHATGKPIGLALRVGAFSGPFDGSSAPIRRICETAAKLVERARAEGVEPAELHIDFDCAENKLRGYRAWIDAIRRAVPDVPISITALPSWLNHRRDFRELVAPLSRYVLQVHSLERPEKASDPITLCDVKLAEQSVLRAAGFGKRFLVALPTYGYLLAFDTNGRFAGLRAEGNWQKQPGHTIREVRSSPAEMALLVSQWSRRSPSMLEGIIWYRLPTAEDQLNWAWPALEKVMAGEFPKAEVESRVHRTKPGLYEIVLRNPGSDEYRGPALVQPMWESRRVLACDSLNGFVMERDAQGTAFKSSRVQLPPQSELKVGWARMRDGKEVEFEARVSLE